MVISGSRSGTPGGAIFGYERRGKGATRRERKRNWTASGGEKVTGKTRQQTRTERKKTKAESASNSTTKKKKDREESKTLEQIKVPST